MHFLLSNNKGSYEDANPTFGLNFWFLCIGKNSSPMEQMGMIGEKVVVICSKLLTRPLGILGPFGKPLPQRVKFRLLGCPVGS